MITDEAKHALRRCIIGVVETEHEGVKHELQKCFIDELLELFGYWVYYLKASKPEEAPPFSNKMGAKILLQMYFKETSDQIFDYLGSNKESFIDKFIKPRSDCIKFFDDSDTDKDNIPTTEEFTKHAASLIFLHIPETSYFLLEN